MGLPDPRSFGSGNPGATNVLRSGSKAAAVLTLAGDALKGWVAVWAAIRLGLAPEVVAVVALAAFLGHVFPVWLRFKGGKGVATAAGVIFAIDWRVGLAVVVVWLTVVVVSRYSSLGALCAALFAPVAVYHPGGAGPVLLATCVMCADPRLAARGEHPQAPARRGKPHRRKEGCDMNPGNPPPTTTISTSPSPRASSRRPPRRSRSRRRRREAASGGAELRKAGYYVAIARRASGEDPAPQRRAPRPARGRGRPRPLQPAGGDLQRGGLRGAPRRQPRPDQRRDQQAASCRT